jgi:hypothetical protein
MHNHFNKFHKGLIINSSYQGFSVQKTEVINNYPH